MVAPFRLLLLVTTSVAALGCSNEADATPPAPATPMVASGRVCDESAMPSLADPGACIPVGPREAPPGFIADATGFSPSMPAARCEGPEIARLGETACAPLDDCDAPFPPKDADVVVRPGAAESPESRVVSTLEEALRRVKPGGTIALDEGVYPPTSLQKSVHLVGRCASKVIFSASGPPQGIEIARPSMTSSTAVDLEVRSVSVRGFRAGLVVNRGAAARLSRVFFEHNRGAIFVGNGASLTMSESVIEGPEAIAGLRDTVGVLASYGGAATLDHVEMRDLQAALAAQNEGTSVRFTRGIIAHERTATESSATFGAFLGASLEIDGSHVEARRGRIGGVGRLLVGGGTRPEDEGSPPASVRITRTSLVHEGLPRDVGSAIDVYDGASLSLEDVTLRHDCFTGIGAANGGRVTARATAFLGRGAAASRSAVLAIKASRVELDACLIDGSRQMALLADERAFLRVNASLVTRTRANEVRDSAPSALGEGGQAIALGGDAQLELVDSVLMDNQGVGLFASSGARAAVSGSTIDGTGAILDGNGAASVGAVIVEATVSLDRSELRGLPRGVAMRRGRARVRESVLRDNQVALSLSPTVRLIETDVPLSAVPENALVSFGNRFIGAPSQNGVVTSAP